MKPVYIFDAVRTPIGNFGGSLRDIRADDLATIPIIKLMERNPKTDWEQVEDVILGVQIKLERIIEILLEWLFFCWSANFYWRRNN